MGECSAPSGISFSVLGAIGTDAESIDNAFVQMVGRCIDAVVGF
jgi:hypothetical protein